MPLTKQGNFTFNHVDQQDDLYKSKSALEIKQAFDSRANELKTTLNDLIDSLTSFTDGNSGADNIGATAIQDLTGNTVQSIIKNLRDILKSVTSGASGADFISSASIAGVTGNTLYSQLSSLKSLIDAVYTKTQLDGGQLDDRYFTETELQSTTSGSSGANKVGATPIETSPNDVQGVLEWLYNQQASLVLGQIPDGSVTKPKLSTDVQNQLIAYSITTGSTNTYAITLNPAPTSYTDGMGVTVKINVDATGASTLNVNGLGAVPIKKTNGNDVTNLKSNGVYTLRYNSTTGNFILQGEGGEYGTATQTEVLSGYTIGTENGIVSGSLTLAGSAVDGDVLTGKTYYNTDAKTQHTGTMANRGAMTITPGTTNQMIPQGYHDGSGVVIGDSNLISANIKQDVNVFGVLGTLIDGTNMKKWASGTGTTNATSGFSVSGLSFQPTVIIVELVGISTPHEYRTIYIDKSLAPYNASTDNFDLTNNSFYSASFGHANDVVWNITTNSFTGSFSNSGNYNNAQFSWMVFG